MTKDHAKQWLTGFIELSTLDVLTPEQVLIIEDHLKLAGLSTPFTDADRTDGVKNYLEILVRYTSTI